MSGGLRVEWNRVQWGLDIATAIVAAIAIVISVWAVRRSGIRAREAQSAAESANLAAARANEILLAVESQRIEAAQWADVARTTAASLRESAQTDQP